MPHISRLVFFLAILASAASIQDQALACPFEDADHCQAFEDVAEYAISDRSVGWDGLLAADDFTPQGPALGQVCVWGFYLDFDAGAGDPDCGPEVLTDHFRVRVYENDLATGRVPDELVGESPMATSNRTLIPNTAVHALLDTEVYRYELTLDPPIGGLTPGQVYWLEISNDTSDSHPSCIWHWMRKTATSTSYSFLGDNNGYGPTFETPAEQAFCLDVAVTASTIGSLNGPCCTCDNNCLPRTLHDCSGVNGQWDVTRTTCNGVTCNMLPANDHCVDGPPLITDGIYTIGDHCATTDGFGPVPSDVGSSQIDFDRWYYYVVNDTPCLLEVTECATGLRFDSVLAVYANCPFADTTGCNYFICPPCPLDAETSVATLAGVSQDESCMGENVGGPGFWRVEQELGRFAQPGECFLLRLGSSGDSRGVATLGISCPHVDPGVPIEVVADDVAKTRFLSFTIPNDNLCTGSQAPFPCCIGPNQGFCDDPGDTAIRIVFQQLHVVNPPYTGGLSIPFTAFVGQSVYVGPPMQFVESGASQIPFLASFTTCTPHYRDWSTVGLLHVTGPQIVPSSIYQVERLSASCQGFETSLACQSGGFAVSFQTEIRTTRWGDVEVLYNPPSPTVQPDIIDVSALVNKFRSAAGAPIKARGLLAGAPGNAWGKMDAAVLSIDFGFSHISACVDAFRGVPYPYRPGKCTGAPTPPATGACAANADCTGANGSGPCQLYCP